MQDRYTSCSIFDIRILTSKLNLVFQYTFHVLAGQRCPPLFLLVLHKGYLRNQIQCRQIHTVEWSVQSMRLYIVIRRFC